MTRASPRLLELATRRLVARARALGALVGLGAADRALPRHPARAPEPPADHAPLGDEYVKAEFRRHRTAQPEFLDKFLARPGRSTRERQMRARRSPRRSASRSRWNS